LLSREASH
jgi:hypothetical protein